MDKRWRDLGLSLICGMVMGILVGGIIWGGGNVGRRYTVGTWCNNFRLYRYELESGRTWSSKFQGSNDHETIRWREIPEGDAYAAIR